MTTVWTPFSRAASRNVASVASDTLAAAATTGAGVPELLNFMTRLLPNPAEGNPPHFLNGFGEAERAVEVSPDPEAHVLAHVFKVSFDPFVGRQALIRLHQGTIRKDMQLFVGDARTEH